MKVLFTHSYFLAFDPKQVAHAQPYAPLGTILAAACVREAGHEVALFDSMFASGADDILPTLNSFRPDVLVLCDDGFNYLTKMCLTNMREAALKMLGHSKARGCRTIVSSSDAADHYEKYLDAGADFVIIGEVERTLLEVMEVLQKGHRDPGTIQGLALRSSDGVLKTHPRAVSRNLEEFPLPAWDLVDMAPYREVWMKKHGRFSVNVATTRGCPYKCNWCAKPIYGNAYHMRSPESVIAELTWLKQLFNYEHVWFCDDIFGLKRSWVTKFAGLVNEAGLKFQFKIQSRADLLVQSSYVADLATAGCSEVWMGAESGSQKILDAMDKGTTVEQIREARTLLRRHGIRAAFFLQFGYPGEDQQDIASTITLVKECLPEDIGISVSYPLPGTVFYERVKDQLGLKQNWDDSDELALMFRNTYPPRYYKVLHRYVHSVFRSEHAARRFRERPGLGDKMHAAGSFIRHRLAGQLHRVRLARNKESHV